jgi:flotillin
MQKAESALAYELQAAKIRQKIRNEEIQIDVVERKKLIEIESQEILRKERELTSTVKLPAEAESYRVQAIAEGKRTQTLEAARAEAERIKKIGGAEALAIELVSCCGPCLKECGLILCFCRSEKLKQRECA